MVAYCADRQCNISKILREGICLVLGNNFRSIPINDDPRQITLEDILKSKQGIEACYEAEACVSIPIDDTQYVLTDTALAVPPLPHDSIVRPGYALGKLCPRKHEHGSTGQSLLKLPRKRCMQCESEKKREKRAAQKHTQ